MIIGPFQSVWVSFTLWKSYSVFFYGFPPFTFSPFLFLQFWPLSCLLFFFFFVCALGINNKQTTLLCILSIDLLFPLSCQLYFYFLRLIS